jgi:two-component system response regulator NreC
VVLAEDHEAMLRSVRMVLEAERDIEVVAEARDLAGALERVLSYRPDVLVLDLRMQGCFTTELIEQLRRHQPGTEIVALTMLGSPAFARHALAAGALGFVVKDSADVELAPAVRRAALHLRYTSPRVASGLELTTAQR